MVKCGNSRKSAHPPLWQTCKVLCPWALFVRLRYYFPHQPPKWIFCEFIPLSHTTALSSANAYHVKFLRSQPKVGPLSSVNSCDHSDVLQGPQHPAAKFRIQPSVVSFATLSQNLHTTSDKCCKNLATRLWVGPLSSTIQLSLPLGRPRQRMGEVTMQVDLVPPSS